MIIVKQKDKKIHFCPVCNKAKLIIENKEKNNIDIELIDITNNKDAKWFIKCPLCKNQIGFVISGITI